MPIKIISAVAKMYFFWIKKICLGFLNADIKLTQSILSIYKKWYKISRLILLINIYKNFSDNLSYL